MSDASIKTLVKMTQDLRFLYFVDMQRVTDISLKAIAQCKNLKALNMADCVR